MPRRINGLQWWIAVLLGLAMVINYLDRQSLAVIVGEVQKSIPLSDVDYSRLQSCFFFGYGLMYAGGGLLVDRLGVRWGYLVVIVWWSIATALHGLTHTVSQLAFVRVLLGLGEGGSFPAAAKVVAERFDPSDRSFAIGIFNSGSSIGAMISAPVIAVLTTFVGWRAVFFIIGCLGLFWATVWIFAVRPSTSPVPPVVTARVPWLELVRFPEMKALLLSKFLSDSAWFFLMMWLPKYLADVRGLNITRIGYYAWIPFAFAALGSMTGGWLSAFLVRRGASIDRSRKSTLLLSACLLPSTLLITYSPLNWAIVLFSIASFGHQFWSTIMQTLPTDLFPSQMVGTAAGLMGAAGAFGGTAFNAIAGVVLQQYHSYLPVFTVAGLLHLISFGVIAATIRPVSPVIKSRVELHPVTANS